MSNRNSLGLPDTMESLAGQKRRSAAMYERPKINVHHHHHVHFKKYFLQCVPLGVAVHLLGLYDLSMSFLMFIFFQQSITSAKDEKIFES